MRLVGEGINPKTVKRIALQGGFSSLDTIENVEQDDDLNDIVVLFIGTLDENHLLMELKKPRKACVELVSEYDDLSEKDIAFLTANDLTLAVRTETAVKVPISHVFATAILERLKVSQDQAIDLETVLHEAIFNAILHGNLEIESHGEDAPNYFQLLEEKVSNPSFGNRKIYASAKWDHEELLITVCDEGKGFSLNQDFYKDIMSEGYSGRGLYLIQALSDSFTLGKDGRSIEMRFRRS